MRPCWVNGTFTMVHLPDEMRYSVSREVMTLLTAGMGQYIREIRLEPDPGTDPSKYPFCLEAMRTLSNLPLHPNVTFLVGENGSGKSTLIEAIAVACGFNPEGGTRNFQFTTEATHSALHRALRVVRGVRQPRDGFFLRAESFYNAASYIDALDREPSRLPPLIGAYGGVSLHRQSHGEAFLALLTHRLGGNGLYLFDEPEAALSPMRQMTMLARIHELVTADSQFVIATPSPILMAYPHARILCVDRGYAPVTWRDVEHVQVTRAFLGDTERMLGILLGERDD